MSKIEVILDRIKIASKDSPISVFEKDGSLIHVFGRTIVTERWKSQGIYNYIGCFDRSYNPVTVERTLKEAECEKV